MKTTNTCTALILRPRQTALIPRRQTATALAVKTISQQTFFDEYLQPYIKDRYEYSKLVDGDAKLALRQCWKQAGFPAKAARTPGLATRQVYAVFQDQEVYLGCLG